MLTIEDVVFSDELKFIKKKSKKTQILISDTKRRYSDYVSKLKYRNNGNYKIIPNYIIDKTGVVYKLFDTNYYSETFGDVNIDKKIIKISLENLGWLSKNTITGTLHNWIGDAYRLEPYFKPWRNHVFWDRYTREQIDSLQKLCHIICDQHNIDKQIVSNNSYFNNAHKFKGILYKSNYSDIYTDINPSFDFNILNEYAKL